MVLADADVKAVPARHKVSVVKSVGIGAIAYPVMAEQTTKPVRRNFDKEL